MLEMHAKSDSARSCISCISWFLFYLPFIAVPVFTRLAGFTGFRLLTRPARTITAATPVPAAATFAVAVPAAAVALAARFPGWWRRARRQAQLFPNQYFAGQLDAILVVNRDHLDLQDVANFANLFDLA